MSNIDVVASTQKIIVNPGTYSVSIISAGPQGPSGSGIVVKGTDTYANIQALPSPNEGDLWIQSNDTAEGDPGDGWVWNGVSWVNVGPIQGPAGPPGADGGGGEGTVASVNSQLPDVSGNVLLDASHINGLVAEQVSTVSYTIVASDNLKTKFCTNNAVVTITIPDTIPVGDRGFIAAMGTAGVVVNAASFTTVYGTESCGQGQGLYWEVLASEALMLRGGEISEGGGDVVAANYGSEYSANTTLFRSNVNAEVAGAASTAVTAHDAETSDVHGIPDTSALLNVDDIGVNVEAYSTLIGHWVKYTDANAATIPRPLFDTIIWFNTSGSLNPTNGIAGDPVLKL